MNDHGRDQQAAASSGHSHAGLFESETLAVALEVEGQLTSGLTEEALIACADLFAAAGHDVKRIIDLGCGPGVGTLQLAQAFPATVLAVDGSRTILDRAKARARNQARITWEQLDLNGDLASLGRCDLVWAAMVVHHADDPVGILTRIRSLLEPGGLLCVLERADPTWISLADDLGRPGIWDRLVTARRSSSKRGGSGLPGEAWAEAYPSMLAQADLELIDQRLLVGTVSAPPDAAGHDFIARHLTAMDRELSSVAEPADAEALHELVEAMPTFRRGGWEGAEVRLSRRLFIARHQGSSAF